MDATTHITHADPVRPAARSEGFTLVELLVVIVVLGVLAAVVVVRVGGISDTSADRSCRIEERQVNSALALYRARNGSYPVATSTSSGDGGVGTGNGNGQGVGNGSGNGAGPDATSGGLASLVPLYLDRAPSVTTASGGGVYDDTRGIFDAAAC